MSGFKVEESFCNQPATFGASGIHSCLRLLLAGTSQNAKSVDVTQTWRRVGLLLSVSICAPHWVCFQRPHECFVPVTESRALHSRVRQLRHCERCLSR